MITAVTYNFWREKNAYGNIFAFSNAYIVSPVNIIPGKFKINNEIILDSHQSLFVNESVGKSQFQTYYRCYYDKYFGPPEDAGLARRDRSHKCPHFWKKTKIELRN